ncbi:MAG: alpha-E domain-containing protein [Bacteroidales bacterium]|nr:alpha-E domain-containing protein [Bacteroidales bacterium]
MPQKITVMSPVKANRLFWLGRYTERVYLCLHLLRRSHDLMIDGEPQDYGKYYENLGAFTSYPDEESAKMGFMYDIDNPNSILSAVEAANDNAIVLREEITTETLSYVQMSLEHIRREAKINDSNITDLQCITDWMLAFWGSVEERVWDEKIRFFLKMGQLIEHIDMNVRFEYKFYRIREAMNTLLKVSMVDPRPINKEVLEELDGLLKEELYDISSPSYKYKILGLLGQLMTV